MDEFALGLVRIRFSEGLLTAEGMAVEERDLDLEDLDDEDDDASLTPAVLAGVGAFCDLCRAASERALLAAAGGHRFRVLWGLDSNAPATEVAWLAAAAYCSCL